MNCSLYEPETQESLFLPLTFKSDFFSPNGSSPHKGSVLLPGLPPASLLEAGQRLLGCTNASAPKRALGTEKQGFLNKAEMLSLKINDSQLWCHRIAHIATAALGIFISFSLLLSLLCFILRHPLLGVGSSLCLEPVPLGMSAEGLTEGIPFI